MIRANSMVRACRSQLGRVACLCLPVLLVFSLALAPLASGAGEKSRAEKAKAHFELGTAYFNLEKYKEALQEFEQAYLEKQDPAFLYAIAQCHRLAGRKPEAIRFYQRFVNEVPGHANRPQAEKWLRELQPPAADASPSAGAGAASTAAPLAAPKPAAAPATAAAPPRPAPAAAPATAAAPPRPAPAPATAAAPGRPAGPAPATPGAQPPPTAASNPAPAPAPTAGAAPPTPLVPAPAPAPPPPPPTIAAGGAPAPGAAPVAAAPPPRAGAVDGPAGGPPMLLAAPAPADSAPASRPVYKRWWFWTLLGAAVIGGAVAAIMVGNASTKPDCPDGRTCF
jgi:hypothetical protein